MKWISMLFLLICWIAYCIGVVKILEAIEEEIKQDETYDHES